MSQIVVIVTCYVCRRKRYLSRWKRGFFADYDSKYTYELWVVAELRSEEAAGAAAPQPSVDRALGAESDSKLGEDLRDAIAEVAAGHVEGMAWKIDDLSENGAAGIITELPDRLQTLADKPLDAVASAAGMPAVAASLSADVAGTVLLKPVLGPVENAVHGLEIAGIVIAVLTGQPWLATTCVKYLAHDQLGATLAKAFDQVISHRSAKLFAHDELGKVLPKESERYADSISAERGPAVHAAGTRGHPVDRKVQPRNIKRALDASKRASAAIGHASAVIDKGSPGPGSAEPPKSTEGSRVAAAPGGPDPAPPSTAGTKPVDTSGSVGVEDQGKRNGPEIVISGIVIPGP